MTVEQYQQTVASLSAALTELNIELRDKTNECEALYDTANELSKALQESDRVLTEKSLECEKLQLKLSMTSFLEVGQEPDLEFLYTLPEREPPKQQHQQQRAAAATHSKSKPSPHTNIVLDDLSGKITPNVPVKPIVTDIQVPSKKKATPEDVMPKKHHPPHSSAAAAATFKQPTAPICVDDVQECDDCPESIRQAHFYNVILERDRAQHVVQKLSKEVKYLKQKTKDYKTRLEKSHKMVEVSYNHTTSKPRRQRDTVTLEKRPSVSWLRKHGQSVRSGSSLKKKSHKDKDQPQVNNNKEEDSDTHYMDAIAGTTDADKAGGSKPHRQLISM